MTESVSPEGKLDLSAVGPLHEALLNITKQDVVLDLVKVSHFGALCAQTCLAAAQSAKAADTQFRIVNASDQVLDQLNAMGLTPETLAEGLT